MARSKPDAPDKASGPKEPTHRDNIDAMLTRYEAEFVDVASNPHAPADRVAELLHAIHALRLERTHHNPNK